MDYPLDSLEGLRPNDVLAEMATHKGERAVRLTIAPGARTADCPTFALIEDLDFKEGSMEVEVAGQPAPGAPEGARGFVGLTFRIAPDLSRFEGLYLRPTNGRAPVQLRRNRSVQYFSYPDFKFDRSRAEAPGEYESYVDLVPGDWTRMRIEVEGEKARLYVHGAEQPTLVVNDLKLGPAAHGSVGLFIDTGTEGFFRNLRVTAN